MDDRHEDERKLLEYLDRLRRATMPKLTTTWGLRQAQKIASSVYQLQIDYPADFADVDVLAQSPKED